MTKPNGWEQKKIQKNRGKSMSPALKYLRKEIRHELLEIDERRRSNSIDPKAHQFWFDALTFVQRRIDVAVLIEKEFLDQAILSAEERARIEHYKKGYNDGYVCGEVHGKLVAEKETVKRCIEALPKKVGESPVEEDRAELAEVLSYSDGFNNAIYQATKALLSLHYQKELLDIKDK